MAVIGGHFMVILCMVLAISVERSSKWWYSTMPFNTDNDDVKEAFDDFLGDKVEELQPQGVDPRRGWGFRGVHKVISSFS